MLKSVRAASVIAVGLLFWVAADASVTNENINSQSDCETCGEASYPDDITLPVPDIAHLRVEGIVDPVEWTTQYSAKNDAEVVQVTAELQGAGGPAAWAPRSGVIDWTSEGDLGFTKVDEFTVAVPRKATGSITLSARTSASGKTQSVTLVVYDATVTVRRKGSGNDYGSTAIIAACGKESDVHKADVVVETTLGAGVRAPFTVAIKSGEGGGEPGTNGPAILTMESYGTDLSGKIHGIFTSSNKVQNVTVECYDASGNAITEFGSVTISQRWDDRGPASGWMYDPHFWCDVPSPVSQTLVLGTDEHLGIDSHVLRFHATIIYGWAWNDNTCEYESWLAYDENVFSSAEIAEKYPDVDVIETYENLDSYATFDCDGLDTTDENGMASRNLILHENPDREWIITDVHFWATDAAVYMAEE